MRQALFSGVLFLLLAAGVGAASAEDPALDYRAIAKLAKADYDNGDLKAAAAKTHQVLDILKVDPESNMTHQLMFLEQYLDIAGGTPEKDRKAALNVQDDFDVLADRTGLGDTQVQDLGFRIVRMLAGRQDKSNVAASYDWLKAAYLRQTDDPWFAIQFDLQKASQLRTYRSAGKSKRRFKEILESAQAIDPQHFVTLKAHLMLAKLEMEIGRTRIARRDLRALADAWMEYDNPPSLEIIQALGMLAGSLADSKKFDEMDEVYAQMLSYEPPHACDPIPIYRKAPLLNCMRCGKDGQMLVKYDIDDKGLVTNIRTLEEDVPKVAQRILSDTMSEWRYYPAVMEGTPTPTEGVLVLFNVIAARP